jgi:nucleotide-binding universal stress UspA family protein
MTKNIARILVPIDFSSHSREALDAAIVLATRLGATIELLHVVDDPVRSGAWNSDLLGADFNSFLNDLLEHARARLRRFAEHVPAGLAARSVVLAGQPARTIVEHAWTGEFDLIVMGTHGRTGLSHLLLGSIAERVIRTSPCAVLTVKDAVRDESAHELSLATVVA